MTVIEVWTGRYARALQAAMRLTNEAFAEHLGISPRTVAKWRKRPEMVPSPQLQEALDTCLRQAEPETRTRFTSNLGTSPGSAVDETVLSQLHLAIGELTRVLAAIPTARDLAPATPDRLDDLQS